MRSRSERGYAVFCVTLPMPANVWCLYCSRSTSISPGARYRCFSTLLSVLALHVPDVHPFGEFVTCFVRTFTAAGTLCRESWRTKLSRLSVPTLRRGTCRGGWWSWTAFRTRGAARRWACVESSRVESSCVDGQAHSNGEISLTLLYFPGCLRNAKTLWALNESPFTFLI